MGMVIAMTIFSLVGTVLISFSMLPQTIVTMRTKQTANLSFGLYLLMGFATFLIFFYGIGLIMVPTDIKEIVKNANSTTGGIWENYFSQNFIDKLPDKTGVILGYLVPGIAIIIGEVFCSITSFMIAYVKIKNKKAAAKLGITEVEYIKKTYGSNKLNSNLVEESHE